MTYVLIARSHEGQKVRRFHLLAPIDRVRYKGRVSSSQNMSKSLGHFFLVLFICGLSVGCADFNTVERFGVIQIRLPAENKAGLVDVKLLDQKVPEGIELVEAILKTHQFSRMSPQGGQEESNTAVALQLMTFPNTIKPVTMPQELRSTWSLPIEHPGTISDKVFCSIYPTAGSNLLQVSVKVEYAWPMPPSVTQFWHDLVEGVTQKYGTNRITIDSNL